MHDTNQDRRKKIKLNDGSRVTYIEPIGQRRRKFKNQRRKASPEALTELLAEKGIGYRKAAELIGIRPEKMHSFTRPVGHPRHRPCAGAVYLGLLIAIENPELAERLRTVSKKHGKTFLDTVRMMKSQKMI